MPFTDMRPSLFAPPFAEKNVIVGDRAMPLLSTVRPGVMFSRAPAARVAGMVLMTSVLSTTSLRELCTSTTGVSPVTVTVSWSAPTLSSVEMVRICEPARMMFSRFTVLNPGRLNVSE